MLTQEQVAEALPANLRSAATPQFTDLVNNIASDPVVAEQVRNNFVSYSFVLKDGKFKTEDYLHAVTYVSYKLMNMSNLEAYQRTFPARYQALVARGTASKDIAAYVAAYHRGKLVNMIMEQVLVPTWVLNQDIQQRAINVLADLMLNANSEKVRSDSATSLLTHLKQPEVQKVQLDIGVKDNSGMIELKNSLRELAQKQQELIESGVSPKLIAAQPLVEAEYTDVDPD